MHLQKQTRRGGTGFAEASFQPGMPCEDTIPAVIVNRLQRRFGVSEPHALTIARLASLGPKEGRD